METCHVAFIPYPGRGHVNPLLFLAHSLLSRASLSISFIVTDEWLSLLSTAPRPPAGFRFVTVPNCLPSEEGRARDFTGFLKAAHTKMAAPVEAAMRKLRRIDAIVADVLLPWAVEVGERMRVPVCSFFPMSSSSAMLRFGMIAGVATEALGNYMIPAGHTPLHHELVLQAFSKARNAQCFLLNSYYELEAPVIDAMREELHCPVLPIGPSIPHMFLLNDDHRDNTIEWLDLQPEQSVLYVSFGSFLSASESQLDEIARGLSLSGSRFLWVARGDYPSPRLQEMVGSGMGIVVPWCDQLKVLNHRAVGCFLTHCGWNSTLEAVFCGVPMLTLPILADQPINSKLITDEWMIGASLQGEVREEISLAIKRLMDVDASKDMRKRAGELRDSARRAVRADGSSPENLDALVKFLHALFTKTTDS